MTQIFDEEKQQTIKEIEQKLMKNNSRWIVDLMIKKVSNRRNSVSGAELFSG